MAKKPTPDTPPLAPLVPYSGRPNFPERPAFGLKALKCPHCGHTTQRLMRAHQWWRDASDALCPQIHVELDFFCWACERGWQMQLFNEDEGGEFLVIINEAETVNEEDAQRGIGSPPAPPEP
jgi:hypothetical protein